MMQTVSKSTNTVYGLSFLDSRKLDWLENLVKWEVFSVPSHGSNNDQPPDRKLQRHLVDVHVDTRKPTIIRYDEHPSKLNATLFQVVLRPKIRQSVERITEASEALKALEVFDHWKLHTFRHRDLDQMGQV